MEMDIVDEQIDTVGKAFLGLTWAAPAATTTSSTRSDTPTTTRLAGIFQSSRSRWRCSSGPTELAVGELQAS